MKQRYLGGLYLLIAAGIWGGMYVVSKVVLESISPLGLVWFRYLIALVALVAIGILTRQSWRIHIRDIPLVIAIGIIGYALSIWAQFFGTKLSSAQFGAMITSATPAFMVIFAKVLLGERITWRKALSVALATFGVLFIVGVGHISKSFQMGGLVLLVAALTWGLMSVLVKRIPKDYSQIVVTSYAIFSATVAITPFVTTQMNEAAIILTRPALLGGVLYLGVVSTAGAFFLWNKGLQMVDAASGSLYFFFQPVVGTLLGWLVLGEQVNVGFWIGSGLILSAIVLVIKQ